MKSYTITVTENELRAINEFLRRTPLTGKEVPAFNALVKAVAAAKEVVGEMDGRE